MDPVFSTPCNVNSKTRAMLITAGGIYNKANLRMATFKQFTHVLSKHLLQN